MTKDVEPLRIFFFSDWRVQPLDLIDALLETAQPVDLILYGGDDIRRFRPLPPVPPDVAAWAITHGLCSETQLVRFLISRGLDRLNRLPQSVLARLETDDPESVINYAAGVLGRSQTNVIVQRDETESPARMTLGEIMALFEGNVLSELAGRARFGLGAVLGNDCRLSDREVLDSPGVRDLHARPGVFGGWGFAGIAGAITRPDESGSGLINGIGHILYPEALVAGHLMRAIKELDVSPRQLIVVSHTPPADCRLDIGLRFGLERLGSPALTDFIREQEPALVACGHCHCRGGRSAHLGTTLVVNGASDDQKVTKARAALIELNPAAPPAITWLDPTPHHVIYLPGIGHRKAGQLARLGITRPDQLFDADDEVFQAIRFGPARRTRLMNYQRAQNEQRPIWLAGDDLKLPETVLFYDVETGLQQTDSNEGPWLIGALASGASSVEQFMAIEGDPDRRKQMLMAFLEFVQSHPGVTLCSWSGTRYDRRSIVAGLSHWGCDSNALRSWELTPEVDLLTALRSRLVLPTADWSLKTMAELCGFQDSGDEELDGFEVGLAYEEYRRWQTPLPVEEIRRYNAWDVKALAHVFAWAQREAETSSTCDLPEIHPSASSRRRSRHPDSTPSAEDEDPARAAYAELSRLWHGVRAEG